jgi:hypothetical protein
MAPDAATGPVKKPLKLLLGAPSVHVKPRFMQKSKYRHLLNNQNVYRWFRKLLRRGPLYLLGVFRVLRKQRIKLLMLATQQSA